MITIVTQSKFTKTLATYSYKLPLPLMTIKYWILTNLRQCSISILPGKCRLKFSGDIEM